MAPYDVPEGRSYSEVINQTIKDCSCYMVVLSEAAQHSSWVSRELERAITYRKPIVPVQFENVVLSTYFEFMVADAQIVYMKESDSCGKELLHVIKTILDKPKNEITIDEKKQILYSQILDLQKGDAIQFCEKLCDLIELLIDELNRKDDDNFKINILNQIINAYEMYWKNCLGYGNEYKATSKRLIHTLSHVDDVLNMDLVSQKKVLLASIAISIIYSEMSVRDDCIEVYTNGDVHKQHSSYYIEKQAPFVSFLATSKNDYTYTEDELQFINESKKRIVSKEFNTEESVRQKGEESNTYVDERYGVIADYFSKGNELFNLIGHDKNANELYNCLLISYERLKNYCLEVGEKRVYGECVIKITELKQLMAQCNKEKSEPTEAERGIKALLGLTLPKNGMYDAFISYKHYDEDRAKKIFTFLQQLLKEVFFDKESLPELSKSDYEHAVMTALGNSKHFIVIISDIKLLASSDFIEGDWVRREMRTFNTEIQEGRKKDSNFIILASDEVCDQVFAENKENIDIMWRWPEIIRFSEFDSALAKYIK